MLHDHGISVWGSFVFGFDTDDPEVFERTVEFAIDMKLTMASFAVLTPYPGTQLYRRLLAERRLVDPQWWLRDDVSRGHPYFVPKRMTREVLRDGWACAWRRTYSSSAMWRRFTLRWQSSWLQTLGYWPLNLMQRRIATTVVARAAREGAGTFDGPRGLVGCDA
jgi:radical SAM superfamily enzyme YgiQ (UPF0313 family)